MERGLVADLAIVHAWKGDREGNLVYRKTARNFNPVMATAGKVTVAEVEHLVEPGEIDPDHIHTPGIFVQRIVHYPAYEKRIEQRTVRKRAGLRQRRQDSNALVTRRHGAARRRRAEGRVLRQSRDRHPDAGVELHPGRHHGAAAERERHARHGAVPV